MAAGEDASLSLAVHLMVKQFEEFRHQLDDSNSLRERIRKVALDIESATCLMHSNLLLIHESRPLPEVLEKAKGQIDVLRELYGKLAEIIRECPGQYDRYHDDFKTETQNAVSRLAFMHWLETESLLLHAEAEEKLGCMFQLHLNSTLKPSDVGLDVEDYLIGICFMSNDLPRYVVNQVTSGDYDCPRKVLKFMTELHAAFRMLNFRNDFLRKKFDVEFTIKPPLVVQLFIGSGMKYDLRKLEEVYYDVKIRGLATHGNSTGE